LCKVFLQVPIFAVVIMINSLNMDTKWQVLTIRTSDAEICTGTQGLSHSHSIQLLKVFTLLENQLHISWTHFFGESVKIVWIGTDVCWRFRVSTQLVDVQHLIYWQGQHVCDELLVLLVTIKKLYRNKLALQQQFLKTKKDFLLLNFFAKQLLQESLLFFLKNCSNFTLLSIYWWSIYHLWCKIDSLFGMLKKNQVISSKSTQKIRQSKNKSIVKYHVRSINLGHCAN